MSTRDESSGRNLPMEGNSISATPIVLYEYAPNGTSSANDSQWQATATHNLSTDPINVIQLATWNIWFDELEQKTRFTAVLEMILSIPSLDIVSLQEVTPSFLDLAQKHHSIQSEWVMTDCWDTEHQKERQGSGKGNIFLIKKRWASNIRAWVKKFPTSTMERFVVILDMFQGDASLVRIANAHFDSKERDEERRRQFQLCRALLSEDRPGAMKIVPSTLFLLNGDLNTHSSVELDHFLSLGFQDSIIITKMDPAVESRQSATLNVVFPKPGKQHRRSDFILWKSKEDEWECTEYKYFGNTPVKDSNGEPIACSRGKDNQLYPSDHIAVLAEFKKT